MTTSPTSHTDAVTAKRRGRVTGVAAAAFRPAVAVYLGFCLAGLAVGLWPGAVHRPADVVPAAPVPGLRALAVAQVAFLLLAYPLVWLRRAGRAAPPFRWYAAPVESLGFLVAAVPFQFAGAYFQDATAVDAVRSAVGVAFLLPLAWAAAWWMGSRSARAPVLLALAGILLGLPAAYYIARDFLAAGAAEAEWLWRLGPATFAWEVAAQRQDIWLPRPVWAAVVWPAGGIAALLTGQVCERG